LQLELAELAAAGKQLLLSCSNELEESYWSSYWHCSP